MVSHVKWSSISKNANIVSAYNLCLTLLKILFKRLRLGMTRWEGFKVWLNLNLKVGTWSNKPLYTM